MKIARTERKIRVASNPQRPARKRPGAKPKAKRRNPLFLMGPVNPERSPMKKGQKKNPSRPKAKAKRPNPFVAASKPTTKKRRNGRKHASRPRRKNPTSTRKAISTTTTLFTEGLIALMALVATRQLPQMILKDKNQGYLGWLANLLTALGAGYAANKAAGKRAGAAAVTGGAMYLAVRVLQEKFSPLGQYLSLTGLGDATAATSLGDIHSTYYLHPTTYNPDGSPYVPPQLMSQVLKQIPAPAPASPPQTAMSGLLSRKMRGKLAAA